MAKSREEILAELQQYEKNLKAEIENLLIVKRALIGRRKPGRKPKIKEA